ncbi:MAG: Fe-S cluster assembly protein HesB [Candidatus Zixiibacteriota bacterium]
MTAVTTRQIAAFRRKIWRFYKTHCRDLPFRNTTDPYHITVSELMLQQTQVERVIPKYLAWIKKWPNWASLANASTKAILAAWSGLGYNRRALHLHKLARVVTDDFGGQLPTERDALQKLPGIGPYTAGAILIFAYNKNIVTIDTNIRRVLLYELKLPVTLPKRELEQVALTVLPHGRSRDWHNALMDYGALALPRNMNDIPPESKQSKFEGSLRQIRGEIVRRLTEIDQIDMRSVAGSMDRSLEDVQKAALALAKDGLVEVTDYKIRLVK